MLESSDVTYISPIGITKDVLDAVHQQQTDRLTQWTAEQVVDAGTYQGTCVSSTKDKPAPIDHILANHDMYSIRLRLTVGDREVTQFHRCTGDAIKKPNGQYRVETVAGALLAEATGTVDQPFEATLEAAKGRTFTFKLSYTAGNDDGLRPRNWINGITKV